MSENVLHRIQNDNDGSGFRITPTSWFVLVVHLTFCVAWPIANGRPVFSLVWGVFLMGGFLAAAVGLGLSRVAHRVFHGSNGVANFLFCLVISIAFVYTALEMVEQEKAFRSAFQQLVAGVPIVEAPQEENLRASGRGTAPGQ